MPNFYHTYVANRFAEENTFGARYCQPWPWAYYNRLHPGPEAERMPEGNRPDHLPSFAEARALLPQPFWDGHSEAIACYWKVWELAFERGLRRATAQNRFVSHFNATAFNDATFMWDSAFIAMFGRYGRRAWHFQGTLDNFYCKQPPDGFICREIGEADGEDRFQRFDPAGTGPNVLPWAEWEYYRHTGDRARLARVFPPLAAYTRWFRLNRTWPDGSYWATGWSCGMDNQPRVPPGRHEWYEHCHQSWVDTCMQAVLADRVLVAMAREIGREADATEFADEADSLSAWINERLWDDDTGFYHDLRRDGSRVREVKTIGAYWALLAGLVPAERLPRFLAHLEDERTFRRRHRVPSLSADTPGFDPGGGYWRGAVWSPTNYMLLRGLEAVGQPQLAHVIGLNHLNNVVSAFRKTGTLWENYAPDADGEGRSKTDFVGWTGLTPVAVLFEQVFGLQPAGPDYLVWHVRLAEAHGVNQYPLGMNGWVDLHCAARRDPAAAPQITANSNVRFTLEIHWGEGRHFRQITSPSSPCDIDLVNSTGSGSARSG